jgi:hypothetical protein
MSLNTEQPAEPNSAMPPAMTPLGRGFYEQLLALADTIGAAYADAYGQIGAAYAHACRDVAGRVGSLEEGLADRDQPSWATAFNPLAFGSDRLAAADDDALAVGEALTQMARDIGLALVEAAEQATLAAATCDRQVADVIDVPLLSSVAATRADLARKIVHACGSTCRKIMA